VIGDVPAQRTGVDDAADSQRPPEGSTPFRQCETGQVGMDVRSPTGQATLRVGDEADAGVVFRDLAYRDDSQ